MKRESATENELEGALAAAREEVRAARAREAGVLRALALLGARADSLVHDIKSPAASVNLALRAVARALGEDERSVVEDLVVRMRRLERAMLRTLGYATPVEVSPEVVPLSRVIAAGRKVAGELAPGLAIEVDDRAGVGERGVLVDERRTAEVLGELAGNALRAGARRVRLRTDVSGGGAVELLVEDDGPGLERGRMEAAFAPFTTSDPKGIGLGLTLSRRVAEEQGGALEPGEGTLCGACFSLLLPAPPAEEVS